MSTIYTKEELDATLKTLKAERLTVLDKRKSILNKYKTKQSKDLHTASVVHDLDRKIEDIERKLGVLF